MVESNREPGKRDWGAGRKGGIDEREHIQTFINRKATAVLFSATRVVAVYWPLQTLFSLQTSYYVNFLSLQDLILAVLTLFCLYAKPYSLLYKRKGNWVELTFSKASGAVKKKMANSCPALVRCVHSDYPRNNCWMHFGSSFLLVS